MSGLYLTVWDDAKFDEVLAPTTGGWPHITVAHTGNNATLENLKEVGAILMEEWMLRKIVLKRAYVNSFEKESGWRHDVLLELDEKTTEGIEETRNRLVRAKFSNSNKFSMHAPHVTVAIYSTKEEAQAHVDYLNSEKLPRNVFINGVTLD